MIVACLATGRAEIRPADKTAGGLYECGSYFWLTKGNFFVSFNEQPCAGRPPAKTGKREIHAACLLIAA
jgi:hypothetical protein